MIVLTNRSPAALVVKLARYLPILIAALLPAVGHADDGYSKATPSRVELYQIVTMTLSDTQFLKGIDGAPATVTGQFRIAQGEGRVPVVVMIHGSGGMGPNIDVWANELNAMGISTFAIDGFTGRGLTSVSADQGALGRLNFILDIYRSLDILAKHPRVDPKRIALMGFSRGGQAALYASLKRFHKMWNRSGVEFAAYLPFYADCKTSYVDDTDIDKPVRMFHGTPDDYNPVAPCKAFVARLKEAGRDVVLTEYPNASHSFDNPSGSRTPRLGPTAMTVRNCAIHEEPTGTLINDATHAAFTYKDACVERGTHTGYDPEAAADAHKQVDAFLAALFKLGTTGAAGP
jgi:dienelactone hydrolase